MYQEKKAPRSEFVPIRGLEYHTLVWGQPGPGRVPLVLLHGWMDVAASYQFMVDALAGDRYVIAPDWRGFGLTRTPLTDSFWFPDYLADLDLLLDHYSSDAPVDLVGHSMGGNVAMLYSGARPQRIRRLVNLEGFGMAGTKPSQAPGRYALWMDELKAYHRGELNLKAYESASGVAERLMKTNRRLSRDRAEWLALHWARPDADGRWRILGQASHKVINPELYRADEVMEIYRAITAPTLSVETDEDSMTGWHRGTYTLADYHQRLKAVPNARVAVVQDAGHMLHHDQPEALARLIEEFLAS